MVADKAAAAMTAGTTLSTAQGVQRLASQQARVELGERLVEQLGASSAGFWLDQQNDAVVVNVTDQQATAKVRQAGAVAKVVAHNTATLESIQAQLAAMLPTDASAGIDVAANRIEVQIGPKASGSTLATLENRARALGSVVEVTRVSESFTTLIVGGYPIARSRVQLMQSPVCGTISKARLGYLNVYHDVDGREMGTVTLDVERAGRTPCGFEMSAAGRTPQPQPAGSDPGPQRTSSAGALTGDRALADRPSKVRVPHDTGWEADAFVGVADQGTDEPFDGVARKLTGACRPKRPDGRNLAPGHPKRVAEQESKNRTAHGLRVRFSHHSPRIG